MDFNQQQFIIELKRWYGESKHKETFKQLFGYLDKKNAESGYLLTFDMRKSGKLRKAEWVEFGGKRIFDVVL